MDAGEQSSKVLFVPTWARFLFLAVIMVLFAAAAWVIFAAVQDKTLEKWTPAALGLLQTAGAGALVLIFLLFAERGQRAPRVDALTRQFLTRDIPAALAKMEHKQPALRPWHEGLRGFEPLGSNVQIKMAYADRSYDAFFVVGVRGIALGLSVEANVKRVNVIYFLPGDPRQTPADYFAAFQDTLSGARDAKYHVGVASDITLTRPDLLQQFGWNACFALPLHLSKEDGFLYRDIERQFVAQDISIMTRSLVGEAVLAGKLQPRATGAYAA